MLIFFQYLLCSFATSQMVSASTSDDTRGGNSGGASPNNIRPTANAQLESDSSVYPPCSRKKKKFKAASFHGQTHFKCNHYLSPSKSGKHVCHVGISCRRNTAFPENVAIGRIKSSRDCRKLIAVELPTDPSYLLITSSGANSVAIGMTICWKAWM
jgi:hypothetical protein